MKLQYEKVLVLSPHTDDGELGCGGTIARLVDTGAKVYYAAFSTAEKSVPQGFPSNVLETEVRRATALLGVPADNLFVYKYEVRKLSTHRQEILDELVKLNRNLAPDLVLQPSLRDIHQDHTTVAQESLRAFKRTTILGYELIWNNLTFDTTAFVALDESHITRKCAALAEYKSQAGRDYTSEEFLRALALARGVQIGKPFAETFEVIRWVL